MRALFKGACVLGAAMLATACASGPRNYATACTAASHARECEFLKPFQGETSFGRERTREEGQALAHALHPARRS